MKTALPLFAVVLLAACQPADGQGTDSQTVTPAANTQEGTRGAQDPTVSSIIALDSEGLRLVDETTGSTRLLPFGAPQAEAEAAITAILGQATETGDLEECGPGPLHYANFDQGLQLLFSGGTFSGWASRGALTTMNGLSADANRAELQAAGVTAFTRDTLEDEFELGGIYGVMEAGGQEVGLLHVGDNCFMR